MLGSILGSPCFGKLPYLGGFQSWDILGLGRLQNICFTRVPVRRMLVSGRVEVGGILMVAYCLSFEDEQLKGLGVVGSRFPDAKTAFRALGVEFSMWGFCLGRCKTKEAVLRLPSPPFSMYKHHLFDEFYGVKKTVQPNQLPPLQQNKVQPTDYKV